MDKFSSIDGRRVLAAHDAAAEARRANSSVRLSFNQAFRAPSFINNHLQTSVLNEVNLSPISPVLARFIFPVGAVGNPNLEQESLTAYEIGYTGALNRRATVTRRRSTGTRPKDAIFFTPVAVLRAGQSAAHVAGGHSAVRARPAARRRCRRSTPIATSGTVKDKGFELGVEAVVTRDVNVFVNYSFQADPVIEGFDPREANKPANNRFNAGFNVSHGRFLGNLDVSYSGIGLLAGRARPALRGHDRRLHAGERRRSACGGRATRW